MKGIIFIFVLFIWISPLKVHASIVETNEIYTYEALTKDLFQISEKHHDLITYRPLGTTPFGKKVWAVKLGHGDITILLHGAHHAREWLTSTLLMKMIETYADAYKENQKIEQFDPRILDEVSIWFVPMVNPDGVALQQLGLKAYPFYVYPDLITMNNGSMNFKRWKANIQGVDLNRQYPANWENLKGVSKLPSYQFYKGKRPLEAYEVKALVDFTRKIKPEVAVSYHSSGNVLFWGFHIWGINHTTFFTDDYYRIAEKVSDLTKYRLEEPASYQQGGGYTDWFIEEFQKPALTIEIGTLIKDNSLPLREFPIIWEKNKAVGLLIAEKAKERIASIKKKEQQP